MSLIDNLQSFCYFYLIHIDLVVGHDSRINTILFLNFQA